MKCAGCQKTLNKESLQIKCSDCGKTFCSPCINIPAVSLERRKFWKCRECAKKGSGNSHSPAQPHLDSINVPVSRIPDCQVSPSDSPVDARSVKRTDVDQLQELTSVIRGLTTEISSLKVRLEETTASLTCCNVRLEDLTTIIRHQETRISNLEAQAQETNMLKATVAELKNELNMQSQINLKNEVEISGIEEHPNENLEHIVMVAGRKLGVDIVDQDIDWVSRVGPRKPLLTTGDSNLPKLPRPIVVRLLRRAKRDQLLKSSKVRRNITSTDLDIQGTSRKVYFNERLTKDNRKLFRDARNLSKRHGFVHCWCNQGAIYVRQREGKPPQQVRSHEDLDHIFCQPVGVSAT